MKKELVLVYVDYGACNILNDPKSRKITPDILQPMISDIAMGSHAINRHVFLDTRGIEEEGGSDAYNNTITQWSSYTIHTCPRIGHFTKETIDPTMIEQIHHDIEILHEHYSLHIVLVIGDVDYRPLILRLIDSYKVSLIATKPHATLHHSILSRCHVCYATFEIDDAQARIFKTFDFASREVAQQLGSFQANYKPTSEQVQRALAFSGTSFTCHLCKQEVLTGNLRAHPCFKAKDAPPGLPTIPYIQEMAKALSSYSVPELLEYLILALHNQTLPYGLTALFESMPYIPWSAIETATLAHQIEHSVIGLPVEQVHAEYAKFLAYVGIIQRSEDRYSIVTKTKNFQALRPLVEESYSRIHYPYIMRALAPEGAIKEERLRERIAALLASAPHLKTNDLSATIEPTDHAFWESDTALMFLTNPQLSPSQRRDILYTLDEVHPFVFWMKKILSIKSTNHDVLDKAESIASSNPFMTERSIVILVANDILQFNPEREQLIVNSSHPIFIPFDNLAVA